MTGAGLRKAIADARRRALLTIGRAVLRLVNDAAKVQQAQATLLSGETLDGIERFQEYGLTSVPLPGMEALVVFPAASRAHGVVVAIGDRLFRLQPLQPGEVALYDHLGKFVHLRADGTLHIKAPKIVIEAEEDLRLYAGATYRWDVHGYAQELRWLDATTWQNATWQTGANFASPETNAIDPPKVPL